MICERIITLRGGKGWSQAHLAKKMAMSPKAMKNWESGTTEPNIQSIRALAKVFNVNTDYLLEMSFQETIVLDSLNHRDRQLMRSIFASLLELQGKTE